MKEVADALGMTPRGVIQRLNKGQLKGTRRSNQFGVQEWLVYANKEIMQAVSDKGGTRAEQQPGTTETLNFNPDEFDTVEAEEVSYEERGSEEKHPRDWREVEMQRLEILAEKFVKPLAERIEAQAVAIREQERIIEDQKRQLRLLPDLEKQAADKYKLAELKVLEVEAQRKQIEALQAQLEQKLAPEDRHELEDELRGKDEELSLLKHQLTALEAERDRSQALEARVAELQESKQALEATMQTEIECLREEKDTQARAVQEQLSSLTGQMEKLQRPWWRKILGSGR